MWLVRSPIAAAACARRISRPKAGWPAITLAWGRAPVKLGVGWKRKWPLLAALPLRRRSRGGARGGVCGTFLQLMRCARVTAFSWGLEPDVFIGGKGMHRDSVDSMICHPGPYPVQGSKVEDRRKHHALHRE